MLLQYATAAPDPVPMVDEALLLTLDMLQLTTLTTIATRYTQRCETLPQSLAESGPKPTSHARWNADACQQLRDIGFQEKRIKMLGDALDQWSPCLVPTSALTSSIEQLTTDCMVDATATTRTLLARDPAGASGMPNLQRFSNAVCGLAIVLTKLSEPERSIHANDTEGAEKNDAGLLSSIQLTRFGAQLIVNRLPHNR